MKARHFAGSGIVSVLLACGSEPSSPSPADVADLVRSSEEANQALVRGDIDRYNELVSMTDDFMLMPPNGRVAPRGTVDDRNERMRSFFKGGSQTQELVHAFTSRDMVVLAVIERGHIAVADIPMQDWALRVTIVYRRENGKWRLAHRHADPLVHGITWNEAASFARRG